jgi:hypothetical protein
MTLTCKTNNHILMTISFALSTQTFILNYQQTKKINKNKLTTNKKGELLIIIIN